MMISSPMDPCPLSEKVRLTPQIILQSHFLRRYDWIDRDLLWLVGGLVAMFYFPKKNKGCDYHHPNWRTHSIIFQRGGVQTTNQMNSSEITWSLILPEDRAEALRSALLTAPASAAASAARRRMLGEARPEATLAWQGWEKIEVKGCKRWVCARVLVGLWLGQGWFMVGLWLVYGCFTDVVVIRMDTTMDSGFSKANIGGGASLIVLPRS